MKVVNTKNGRVVIPSPIPTPSPNPYTSWSSITTGARMTWLNVYGHGSWKWKWKWGRIVVCNLPLQNCIRNPYILMKI